METMKEKINTAFKSLKDTFEYTNVMQAPRIEKVVISVGTAFSVIGAEGVRCTRLCTPGMGVNYWG